MKYQVIIMLVVFATSSYAADAPATSAPTLAQKPPRYFNVTNEENKVVVTWDREKDSVETSEGKDSLGKMLVNASLRLNECIGVVQSLDKKTPEEKKKETGKVKK